MGEIKIGEKAKIGNQNAIGDNAKVVITEEQKKETWFVRHPWLSAFIVAAIVAFISLFDRVKSAAQWVESLFFLQK